MRVATILIIVKCFQIVTEFDLIVLSIEFLFSYLKIVQLFSECVVDLEVFRRRPGTVARIFEYFRVEFLY